MVAAKIDMISPTQRRELTKYHPRMVVHPLFENKFIRGSYFESFINRYRGRIFVESILKALHFSPESLRNIFSEKNDERFPSYLRRKEIIDLVVDALKNVGNTVSNTPENKTILNINGEATEDELANLSPFEKSGDLLWIPADTKGTGNNDAFTFWITVDEKTGIIKDFFPLFK